MALPSRRLTFNVFDPHHPDGSRVVRELNIPDELSPEVEAARLKRIKRLDDLREDGELLRSQIVDPVMRAGLRKVISGV